MVVQWAQAEAGMAAEEGNLELEQDAGGRKASWHGGSHWAAVHEKEVEGQAWCWLEQVEG